MERLCTELSNHWFPVGLFVLFSIALYYWKSGKETKGIEIFMNDSLATILGNRDAGNFRLNGRLVDQVVDQLGIRDKEIIEVKEILREKSKAKNGVLLFEGHIGQEERVGFDDFQKLVGNQLGCVLAGHVVGDNSQFKSRVDILRSRLLLPETFARLLKQSEPQYFHVWATDGDFFHSVHTCFKNLLQDDGSLEIESLVQKFCIK